MIGIQLNATKKAEAINLSKMLMTVNDRLTIAILIYHLSFNFAINYSIQRGSFFVYKHLFTKESRRMKLKVSKENKTGLNTEFVNVDSGRHLSLNHVVNQINKGNPNYKQYQTVNMRSGTTYVRSKADKVKSNNIER